MIFKLRGFLGHLGVKLARIFVWNLDLHDPEFKVEIYPTRAYFDPWNWPYSGWFRDIEILPIRQNFDLEMCPTRIHFEGSISNSLKFESNSNLRIRPYTRRIRGKVAKRETDVRARQTRNLPYTGKFRQNFALRNFDRISPWRNSISEFWNSEFWNIGELEQSWCSISVNFAQLPNFSKFRNFDQNFKRFENFKNFLTLLHVVFTVKSQL